MHRDVMLMMSGASVASFLEGKGEGSGVRRANQAAVSGDRGGARRDKIRATPSRVARDCRLDATEAD
jgi:hypothetical protein